MCIYLKKVLSKMGSSVRRTDYHEMAYDNFHGKSGIGFNSRSLHNSSSSSCRSGLATYCGVKTVTEGEYQNRINGVPSSIYKGRQRKVDIQT